jgi:hypothetical protein
MELPGLYSSHETGYDISAMSADLGRGLPPVGIAPQRSATAL